MIRKCCIFTSCVVRVKLKFLTHVASVASFKWKKYAMCACSKYVQHISLLQKVAFNNCHYPWFEWWTHHHLMMGGPIELLLETILDQFSPLFNQPPQITCNYLSCTLKTSGFIHSNFRCITDSMSLQFWQAVTEELFLSFQHGVNVTPHTPITNLYMFLFPSSSVQKNKFFGKAFFNILLEGDFNHETLPLFRSTR